MYSHCYVLLLISSSSSMQSKSVIACIILLVRDKWQQQAEATITQNISVHLVSVSHFTRRYITLQSVHKVTAATVWSGINTMLHTHSHLDSQQVSLTELTYNLQLTQLLNNFTCFITSECLPTYLIVTLLQIQTEQTLHLLCPLRHHQMQSCSPAFLSAFCKHETILSLPGIKSVRAKSRILITKYTQYYTYRNNASRHVSCKLIWQTIVLGISISK